MEAIFDTLKNARHHPQVRWAGTRLLILPACVPKNSMVGTTGGVASGPVSFMKIFQHGPPNRSKQGGTRRGANMAIMRVDHPDIMGVYLLQAERQRVE